MKWQSVMLMIIAMSSQFLLSESSVLKNLFPNVKGEGPAERPNVRTSYLPVSRRISNEPVEDAEGVSSSPFSIDNERTRRSIDADLVGVPGTSTLPPTTTAATTTKKPARKFDTLVAFTHAPKTKKHVRGANSAPADFANAGSPSNDNFDDGENEGTIATNMDSGGPRSSDNGLYDDNEPFADNPRLSGDATTTDFSILSTSPVKRSSPPTVQPASHADSKPVIPGPTSPGAGRSHDRKSGNPRRDFDNEDTDGDRERKDVPNDDAADRRSGSPNQPTTSAPVRFVVSTHSPSQNLKNAVTPVSPSKEQPVEDSFPPDSNADWYAGDEYDAFDDDTVPPSNSADGMLHVPTTIAPLPFRGQMRPTHASDPSKNSAIPSPGSSGAGKTDHGRRPGNPNRDDQYSDDDDNSRRDVPKEDAAHRRSSSPAAGSGPDVNLPPPGSGLPKQPVNNPPVRSTVSTLAPVEENLRTDVKHVTPSKEQQVEDSFPLDPDERAIANWYAGEEYDAFDDDTVPPSNSADGMLLVPTTITSVSLPTSIRPIRAPDTSEDSVISSSTRDGSTHDRRSGHPYRDSDYQDAGNDFNKRRDVPNDEEAHRISVPASAGLEPTVSHPSSDSGSPKQPVANSPFLSTVSTHAPEHENWGKAVKPVSSGIEQPVEDSFPTDSSADWYAGDEYDAFDDDSVTEGVPLIPTTITPVSVPVPVRPTQAPFTPKQQPTRSPSERAPQSRPAAETTRDHADSAANGDKGKRKIVSPDPGVSEQVTTVSPVYGRASNVTREPAARPVINGDRDQLVRRSDKSKDIELSTEAGRSPDGEKRPRYDDGAYDNDPGRFRRTGKHDLVDTANITESPVVVSDPRIPVSKDTKEQQPLPSSARRAPSESISDANDAATSPSARENSSDDDAKRKASLLRRAKDRVPAALRNQDREASAAPAAFPVASDERGNAFPVRAHRDADVSKHVTAVPASEHASNLAGSRDESRNAPAQNSGTIEGNGEGMDDYAPGRAGTSSRNRDGTFDRDEAAIPSSEPAGKARDQDDASIRRKQTEGSRDRDAARGELKKSPSTTLLPHDLPVIESQGEDEIQDDRKTPSDVILGIPLEDLGAYKYYKKDQERNQELAGQAAQANEASVKNLAPKPTRGPRSFPDGIRKDPDNLNEETTTINIFEDSFQLQAQLVNSLWSSLRDQSMPVVASASAVAAEAGAGAPQPSASSPQGRSRSAAKSLQNSVASQVKNTFGRVEKFLPNRVI